MGTIPGEQEGIPSWMDRAFIANALKCGDPTTDESSVELKSVCHVGGGLLSQTFRVVAQFHALGEACDRETSFIVKISPKEGGFIKELVNSGVFTKEKVAYGSFLPTVDAALEAVEGESWRALAAKSYHHGSNPTSFLVVEDLEASGFRKVAQGVNLDVHQCRAVLQNLARMHAASVVLLHDKQYADKLFRQALMFSQTLVDTFQENDSKSLKYTFLSDYRSLHKYKDKIEQMSSRLVEAVDVVKQCQVEFKVMVHGDLHKNNMMFREDRDGLQVRFFDFQGIHIGSPAEDLQYFLHSSASLEVLRDHRDGLLAEYHGVLQQTLRALGLHRQADAFPLQQLLSDMDHFGLVAVYMTLHILPAMLHVGDSDFVLDSSDAEFEEKSTNFFEKIWRNDRYIEYLEYLVPIFDSKGFFDPKFDFLKM